MCGIVGHIGTQNSIGIVLEGLERLEYRGYDSAGLSYVDENGRLHVVKKKGKIENLKSLLKNRSLVSRSCIGHTRWATHGEVSDANSHPHSAMGVSLVHNGIIENATELRNQLKSEGYEFHSETDSEVFLALVVSSMSRGMGLKEAVFDAFRKVHGHSAFVLLRGETSEIVAIKSGAPLVCGISDIGSEALVSSDPYALAGIVNKLYFPEDGVLCHVSTENKNLINFYESDGKKSVRYLSKNNTHRYGPSEKGEFEHFMLKEIHEQPELIRSLGEFYFKGEGRSNLELAGQLKTDRICITACGTAYYAGLVIRDFFEGFNRIVVTPEIASEFRYRNPILKSSDLGLFISQSGETADTLAAQKLCKERGLKTLSLVNVEGSTLFRECDENLSIRAGVEIGVASTKAFTQQVLTGRLLSASFMGALEDKSEQKKIMDKMSLLANRIEELLGRSKEIREIAEKIYGFKGFFFTGRGIYYPIALEGALKLKEIAYLHAEGYPAGELKHGPIAQIDENMVNIAIVGNELYEKTVSNIQEIMARRGKIVIFGPREKKELAELADFFVPLDYQGLEELSPLYVNVACQLLSYSMAKFLGTDIDKPRNLAKSVTVE